MNETYTLAPGSMLSYGTYRIERVLGQGGFGITYLATDVNIEKKVAIKEFFPQMFCHRSASTSQLIVNTDANIQLFDKFKNKFIKEARNIAKLNHPNIVNIYTCFEQNDTAYYAMEYIEGESLAEMVRRNGPLSLRQAVDYLDQIGNALEYIHRENMTHLDVKPANIMVRRADDRPILIDFGQSKQYDSDGNQTSTSPIGVSHGFAPLEQYNPTGVNALSPQTDVYSLAATLYFLLTGKVPPHAQELLNDDVLHFDASVPPYIREAIVRAMSVRRSERHESVAAFISQLKHGRPDSGLAGHDDATEIENSDTEIFNDPSLRGHHVKDKGVPRNKIADRPVVIKQDNPVDLNDSPQSKSKSKTPIVILAVALAIVAIIVYLVVTHGNKKKEYDFLQYENDLGYVENSDNDYSDLMGDTLEMATEAAVEEDAYEDTVVVEEMEETPAEELFDEDSLYFLMDENGDVPTEYLGDSIP